MDADDFYLVMVNGVTQAHREQSDLTSLPTKIKEDADTCRKVISQVS
jgi:hypothetical protein